MPLATASQICEGNPFVFRNAFTDREEARALAGYAWYWRKLLRIAVLTDARPEGGYSREIGREAAQSFAELGGTVVRSAEILPDDPNLTATLRDVLAAAPQGDLLAEGDRLHHHVQRVVPPGQKAHYVQREVELGGGEDGDAL